MILRTRNHRQVTSRLYTLWCFPLAATVEPLAARPDTWCDPFTHPCGKAGIILKFFVTPAEMMDLWIAYARWSSWASASTRRYRTSTSARGTAAPPSFATTLRRDSPFIPGPATVSVFRKLDGRWEHVTGGHRWVQRLFGQSGMHGARHQPELASPAVPSILGARQGLPRNLGVSEGEAQVGHLGRAAIRRTQSLARMAPIQAERLMASQL